MAKPIPTAQLEAIERVVRAHPDGVSAAEIAAALPKKSASRTLQSQLSRLVRDGRLVVEGAGKGTRYRSAGGQDATEVTTFRRRSDGHPAQS